MTLLTRIKTRAMTRESIALPRTISQDLYLRRGRVGDGQAATRQQFGDILGIFAVRFYTPAPAQHQPAAVCRPIAPVPPTANNRSPTPRSRPRADVVDCRRIPRSASGMRNAGFSDLAFAKEICTPTGGIWFTPGQPTRALEQDELERSKRPDFVRGFVDGAARAI
jgi:hypothetical protein